jgi:hypothetical protein
MTKDDTGKSSTGVIRLNQAEEFIEHSVSMLKPVLRTILIMTPKLDLAWLGDGEFIEQLKLAIIKNRRVHVKLVTADPTEALRLNHPIIPLIRKLSRFEARVIPSTVLDKQPLKKSALLVDRQGVLVNQVIDDYVGFAHFDDKHTVKTLTGEFEQYWRFGVEHADLRHVYL